MLFLATPHEQSRKLAPEALPRYTRSRPQRRLAPQRSRKSRRLQIFHEASPAATKAQGQSVYGMPELHRVRIAKAQLVANPGCYATSIILALKPLLAAGWVDVEHGIVCDAKSGVSGAGKGRPRRRTSCTPRTISPRMESFGHRHTGELLEQLESYSRPDHFHAASAADSARNPLNDICHLRRTVADEEIETCLRGFYTEQPAGPHPPGRPPAADPACGAHELLRSRLSARAGWPAMHCHQLPRQPVEGRRRSGGTEHERNEWMARRRRACYEICGQARRRGARECRTLHCCAQAIAELVRDGNQVAVVHGGGVALTRTLKALGKQSEFVAGLRVTDAETRDAALMVLAGRVNKALVAALGSHGSLRWAFQVAMASSFAPAKKAPLRTSASSARSSAPTRAGLKRSGRWVRCPCSSSLALGFDGEYYNINADEMASACAVCRACRRTGISHGCAGCARVRTAK